MAPSLNEYALERHLRITNPSKLINPDGSLTMMYQALMVLDEDEGYPVFPLKPRCKTPIYEGGFHIATRDKSRIVEWWTAHPEANIGVPTGKVSGISVIDVDGAKGLESIRKLKVSRQLPRAFRKHGTPHGHHLLCLYNCKFHNRNGALPGVDIKNNGGYIVWPGSNVDCDKGCTEEHTTRYTIVDVTP